MVKRDVTSYVLMRAEEASWLVAAATYTIMQRDRDLGITISVRKLPEGVYLATSDDVPGLTVECETRDEIIDAARDVAFDLLEMSGEHPDRKLQRFAFIFDR